MNDPLIWSVDCVQLYVTDLDEGLAFYRDALGLELIWRTATAVGLRLPNDVTELVLQTERPAPEVDFKVASVDAAVERIVAAGGRVIVPPFDISIGRCVVVEDPWGNPLVLLDMTRGRFVTDGEGNVIGTAPASAAST